MSLGELISTVNGSVPDWLSGTLVRHACGGLGETDHPDPEMVNRVTHLFDCIEMGQSYSFINGQVTFTSKFYDTNIVDVWRRYEQNMNQSSVFWGTIFAERNVSALMAEAGNIYGNDKFASIPAVSWWQVGNDVNFLNTNLN